MEDLNKKFNYILGSKSPRRKELLAQMGLKFDMRTSEFDEVFNDKMPAEQVAQYLSEQKALSLKDTLKENELIITADTLVILGNNILGKPKDEEDAFKMIKSLSGKWHKVITGVCLLSAKEERSFSETTEVHFKALTDDEIWYYIKNYQPMDKAGAYGIQEWIGLVAVNEIRGCFFNVIGLPVPRLYKEISTL